MILRLTAVVPVYNEEEGVASSLGELTRVLSASVEAGLLDQFEVVVVDDGSDDETPRILAAIEGIRVLRRHRNEGYGSAIKWGVREADCEWILIIDGDASYPASDLDRLLRAWKPETRMIVGARSFSEIPNPRSWNVAKGWIQRRLSGRLGAEILDLNSGMRIFGRRHAESLEAVLSDGFSYSSGITVAFLRGGLGVSYVPIRYRKRQGQSKVRPIAFTFAFLRSVLRAYFLTPKGLSGADLEQPVADER